VRMTHVEPVQEPDAEARGQPSEARVLRVVRELAREVGGARAAAAVSPTASLERDVGLGSLERVELLARLEAEFGRDLADRFLLLDSVVEVARELERQEEVGGAPPVSAPAAAAQAPASEIPAVATIQQALWWRADVERDRVHVHLREEGGGERAITYGELREGAAAIAAGLRARGVRPGETVALMLPTSFDFLRTFQGILAAGAVAVPLYPPVRLDRIEEYLLRQRGILANAGARWLITLPEAIAVAHALRREVPSLEQVTTAADVAAADAPLEAPGGAGEAPALIQYTSGSTGDPKGVLLTHDNLLANIRGIVKGVDLRATDVAVSWLPLYHDMGLIGTWLACLVCGVPLVLQSPLSFLARPERWLWAIHKHRATLSAAPNFAFELCVRKIADAAIEGLDLSSWRCALNGSEPVSPDTLERFARRFERHGFRGGALLPVYGLAESAVALCFPPLDRGPLVDRVARAPFERDGRAERAAAGDHTALRFVSVGTALDAHEVRVVGDTGDALPEREVGRIVFRGPSVTSGYYRNPAATAAVTLPGGWMDSGDLGYRAGGDLYVTGRRKDLIIKGGRNLVPQEIEEVAGSVEGVRKGCVAAVGVADERQGTEQLVVIAETRSTDAAEHARLEAAVVAAVAEAVGVPPDRVLIVSPGAVPKTPSGKVQRAAAKARYLAGALGTRPRVAFRHRVALLEGAVRQLARGALRRAARAAYLAYLALAGGIAFVVVVLPSWALAAAVPSRRLAAALQRAGARLALRLAGCRLSVDGLERLRGGPWVLVSNHASYADVPSLLALLPLDFVIVAKHELLRWPVVGTFVRRAGHPTVDRRDFERGVADAESIVARVRAGESVLFFAEGTFTPASGLRPFRLGAFETAVAAGVPVVPLALRGTRRVLRSGVHLPTAGPVHLSVGAPIAPEGTGWEAAVRLRDRVADSVAARCGEPRLEMVAAVWQPARGG